MFGSPTYAFYRLNGDIAVKSNAATLTAHPNNSTQHVDPFDPHNDRCSYAWRLPHQQPTAFAGEIFDVAACRALGKNQRAFDARVDACECAVPQFAEWFFRQHLRKIAATA